MSVIACQFQGRFGNNLFTYAFCRAYAENHGLELQTDPWIGQKIFGLTEPPIDPELYCLHRDENTLKDGEQNVLFRSYCQQQKCLIYTKRDCLRWFHFDKEMNDRLASHIPIKKRLAMGHRRVGDYAGYGYPLVSANSYDRKFQELGIKDRYTMLTEESPIVVPGFEGELSFLPDFWAMCHSALLLRGNSTFSWWAATLNEFGETWCPDIDGLEGGKEHLVEFQRGNHKKFANLHFVTDLALQP